MLVRHSKEKFAAHMGTALFARLLVWGNQVYNLKNKDFFPTKLVTCVDVDDEGETPGSTKKSGLFDKLKTANCPPIGAIQKLLKKSILDLSRPHFALFQAMIADMWALQTFSKPLWAHFDVTEDDSQGSPHVYLHGRGSIPSNGVSFFKDRLTKLKINASIQTSGTVKRPIQVQLMTPPSTATATPSTASSTNKMYAKKGLSSSATDVQDSSDEEKDDDDNDQFAIMQSNVAEKRR